MRTICKICVAVVIMLVMHSITVIAGDSSITVDGYGSDWSEATPAITDPAEDGLCNAFSDINEVYTTVDEDSAYIMISTHGKPINEHATKEIKIQFSLGDTNSEDDQLEVLMINVEDGEIHAWRVDQLTQKLERLDLYDFDLAQGDVLELRFALSEIGNYETFKIPFVNMWDYDADMPENKGCDPAAPAE